MGNCVGRGGKVPQDDIQGNNQAGGKAVALTEGEAFGTGKDEVGGEGKEAAFVARPEAGQEALAA